MASTYLTRAATGSVTSDKIFTMSVWLKRSTVTGSGSADHWFMHENASSHTQKLDLHFTDDEFRMGWWDGSSEYNLDSKMKFRDTNAWYHIVFRCDTTQATASNRVRVYVNGEQIELQQIGGGSPDAQQPAQNATMDLGTKIICIGRYQASSPSQYFNGCMSHMHYCDGQSYAPTEFGETDSTTGEWKIKPDPSLTYGNNGFWLFKNDNAVTNRAAGTSSGNFTVAGGTFTKTEDNPSNVFATINPLVPYSSNYDFHNGNTTVENDGSSAAWTTRWGVSTLGMSSGKFYAEAKIANIGTNQMYALGLIKDVGTFAPSSSVGANGLGYYSTGNIYNGISGQDQTGLASYTTNDIIGLAIDATNGSAQWYKNGSAIGNAETIATDGTWFFVTNFYTNGKVDMNYGNGYFGTTAVASAGTNASGIGIFEYNVPTGYTALSTKGLNL